MAKEGSFKVPTLTNRQVTEELPEALLRAEYDTKFEEDAAMREGISLEEYQKRHRNRKKPAKPLSKEKKEPRDIFSAEPYLLMSWLLKNTPEGLPQDKKAVEIFQGAILETQFQDIWKYEIPLPERSNEEQLKNYASQIIENLERFSGFDLNSKEIAFLKNRKAIIEKIKTKIEEETCKNIIECPSEETYNASKPNFRYKVSFYFRRKIVIEKLEELVSILKNYQFS